MENLNYKNNTNSRELILKKTDHLFRVNLKGGMVLVNTMCPRPLFINSGIRLVDKIIKIAQTSTNYDYLKNECNDPTLIDVLINHNILLSVESKDLCEIGLSRPASMSLYLLISQDCNMACVYCLAGKNTYKINNRKMDYKVAQAAIMRAVQDLTPNGDVNGLFEVSHFRS